MPKPENCRRCPAKVYWLRHEKTLKFNPIDVRPAADGNIAIVGEDRYKVLASADAIAAHTGPLHTSHFVTCPDATKMRNRPAKRPPKSHNFKPDPLPDHSHRCSRCSDGRVVCYRPDCIVDEPTICVRCLTIENAYIQKAKQEARESNQATGEETRQEGR